jgi:hypothetical protein
MSSRRCTWLAVGNLITLLFGRHRRFGRVAVARQKDEPKTAGKRAALRSLPMRRRLPRRCALTIEP